MQRNVQNRNGGVTHNPGLGLEVPRPDCAPMGQNPWSTYRFTILPVTCKKCLKR